MPLKQVQAVIDAVADVLGDDFTPNSTDVLSVITRKQKALVREQVFTGIMTGEVEYNKDVTDGAAVLRYVNGMVDNHLRRSRVLNGGNTYRPSNSESRRDPQLRELNKLLSTFKPGTDKYIQVQQHISGRASQLEAQKAQKQAVLRPTSSDNNRHLYDT